MKVLKKGSIRRQMTILFVAIMLFVLGVLFAVNLFYLQTYYIKNKEKEFVALYEEMKHASENSLFEDGVEDEQLLYIAEKGNMAFFVMDSSGVLATNVRDEHDLNRQLFGYLVDKKEEERHILVKNDAYQISESKEGMSGTNYIEMWGELAEGQYFLARSPMESIQESVGIANKFLLIVGMIMSLLCLVLIWYFSKKLTAPILELSELSSKMTELNFETRYEGSGALEIDNLGENFNKMSDNLEKTISELKSANVKLQKDIEQREKLEEMRYEFLGNVSHELKTPLALIQGYAEGLRDGISDDQESREFYCDVILDEAGKMNQMVKNLLTLNQLEFGQEDIHIERFDLTSLIGGVLGNMDIMAQQEGVEVHFDSKTPVYVWADQLKIEHVIRNYLSNAFNHVKGQKIIDIKINVQDGKARTSVFNTGDPIPETDMEHIWDKFYKVDKAHTREYGGNGIGLSIVKAIMKSFDQKFGAKNYDNGVEFWFELDV